MKAFSDLFLSRNASSLENYKWARDPVNAWSRRWEYPFAYNSLTHFSESTHPKEMMILDAGSGCTFFPYYLAKQGFQVYCCDNDKSLIQIFEHVNPKEGVTINFEPMDLRSLKYPDGIFDVIYCISVLEHSRNHGDIIRNLNRVLKKDGLLILTFDIEVRPEGLKMSSELFSVLSEMFTSLSEIESPTKNMLVSKDIVTNRVFNMSDKGVLPLRYLHLLRWMARQFIFSLNPQKYYKLTFHCSEWKKQ